MTPALKVMVEAMAAEFERQGEVFAYAVGSQPGKMTLDGEFDLEKVARAGLEALREPDKLMEEAALAEEGCGCPCCVSSDDWEAMIDAILGEKP